MDTNANGAGRSIRSGGSIEDASRERTAEQTEPADEKGGPRPGTANEALATRVRRFYIINSSGEYRFLAQPQRVAFREEGKRLETVHEDPAIIRGMLDVAQSKGWQRINLAGSETFRRIAWLEAGVRGLETVGYVPTLEDRQRLEEWRAERTRVEARHPVPPVTEGVIKAARRERLDRDALLERDAVILAAAEDVLLKRQVGEVTRGRVAAAISRRLEELRKPGKTVPLRNPQGLEKATEQRPVKLSHPDTERSRSR